MRLGLYGLNSHETVALSECPMMSSSLEAWFQEFRKVAPPIRKGSVRLRVSPAGERGVWLDFANQDVKTLFEERDYLKWLSSLAFVEIGQKRKKLTWKDDAPKLIDPELKPWFETYGPQLEAIRLYGPVGGFSQAGFSANRELVRSVSAAAEKSGLQSWVELFCGNGNFSLALASRGYDVEAVEMDGLALDGLMKSIAESRLKLKIHRADVYLKTATLPPFAGRGLLVDPPRAGLREVLNQLEAMPSGDLPPALIYVSCFAEVFAEEAGRLIKLGYTIESLTEVDQFPHSPHAEWVALFTRSPK